jgi:hypothetical protein
MIDKRQASPTWFPSAALLSPRIYQTEKESLVITTHARSLHNRYVTHETRRIRHEKTFPRLCCSFTARASAPLMARN